MQDVRQCSLNLNYWWTVAHLKSFPRSGIKAAKVGTIELVVVKQANGIALRIHVKA